VGAYLLGKETGNRVVEVDFTLKGVSHIDVRNKLTHIRDLLQTAELTLVFDDDPEIYHRGTSVALRTGNDCRAHTFDCDPYRYFVSTKTRV
jgi:predicted phage tail component-like protein